MVCVMRKIVGLQTLEGIFFSGAKWFCVFAGGGYAGYIDKRGQRLRCGRLVQQ